MINNPLVSICIPAFNAENFIKRTLESVLNQTYRNIEIILTDDCSKDSTVSIINSFSDKRICLYQNENNLGVEKNWNKALKLSKGKYCKMMGADDILYPTCLDEQISIFQNPNNNNVVLVSSHKNVINEDDKLLMTRRFPGNGKYNGIIAFKKSLRRGTNLIGEPVAGLFRKEILDKTGYYNGENLYAIDIDLWSRMLKHGHLYVVDKVLYAFRISKKSLSTNMGLSQIKFFNVFVDKIFEDKEFGLNNIDRFLAKSMAIAMGIVRNLFYFIYFRVSDKSSN